MRFSLADQSFCVLQIIETNRISARPVREFEISESLIGPLSLEVDHPKIEVCHRCPPRGPLLEPPDRPFDIPVARSVDSFLHLRNRTVGLQNVPAMEFSFLLVDADTGAILAERRSPHEEQDTDDGIMKGWNNGISKIWTDCALIHGFQWHPHVLQNTLKTVHAQQEPGVKSFRFEIRGLDFKFRTLNFELRSSITDTASKIQRDAVDIFCRSTIRAFERIAQ